MEAVKEILEKTPLFAGISPERMDKILHQKGNRIKKYSQGSFLFHEEELPQNLFVLISGKISIATDTMSGRRILITQITEPGEIFGEVYLFRGEENYYDIYARAEEDSIVFQMSRESFQSGDSSLLQNLLNLFAEKAYFLSSKVRMLGGDTLREKIVRFLYEAYRNRQPGVGGAGLSVKIKRETMSDFLNVARPSLSRELSRMQKEGILRLRGREILVEDFEAFERYL